MNLYYYSTLIIDKWCRLWDTIRKLSKKAWGNLDKLAFNPPDKKVMSAKEMESKVKSLISDRENDRKKYWKRRLYRRIIRNSSKGLTRVKRLYQIKNGDKPIIQAVLNELRKEGYTCESKKVIEDNLLLVKIDWSNQD